jgi:hypothetical protein
MDRSSPYYRQVQLLVRALPYVADEPCFALRGGTAINLFHLPMPRLSVDIDLTYVPIEERGESLANARQALQRIANTMISSSPQLKARFQRNKEDELRVVVTEPDAQVAIELSPVMRGCIHEPMQLDVHAAVQREFGFASMAVLQPPDLYGGKICAALDRQHPRDLFDIKLLLDSNGLTRKVFEGFLVYLICSGRPIAELLNPQFKDISAEFERQFIGMTLEPVAIEELDSARRALLDRISKLMTDNDKAFLLSVKKYQPRWDLAPVRGIERLPAVQWKLANIGRMAPDRRERARNILERVLDRL